MNETRLDSAIIDFKNASIENRSRLVFQNLNLKIEESERVAIVGPEGCGKSTLIRVLGGHHLDLGILKRKAKIQLIEGTAIVRAQARTVHQGNGLFPWYTIRENLTLATGASALEAAVSRADQLVDELISDWGFEDYRNSYPYQLTDGMKQELELACALSSPAGLLLLDEPFVKLDALSRQMLQRNLLKSLNLDSDRRGQARTVVLVTHDVFEAVALADRILVLSEKPARVIGEVKINTGRAVASVTGYAEGSERFDQMSENLQQIQEVYHLLGQKSDHLPLFS